MKEKIISILKEIKPGVDINEKSLVDNGILSSLDILQLISTIDDELDIAIPPMKIKPNNFNSIDNIVKMLEEIN